MFKNVHIRLTSPIELRDQSPIASRTRSKTKAENQPVQAAMSHDSAQVIVHQPTPQKAAREDSFIEDSDETDTLQDTSSTAPSSSQPPSPVQSDSDSQERNPEYMTDTEAVNTSEEEKSDNSENSQNTRQYTAFDSQEIETISQEGSHTKRHPTLSFIHWWIPGRCRWSDTHHV